MPIRYLAAGRVDANMAEFHTERLPFAIAIHASGRLAFLRCERTSPEHVEFVFADPENKGTEAELEFDRRVRVGVRAVRIPLEALQKMIAANTIQAQEERNGR